MDPLQPKMLCLHLQSPPKSHLKNNRKICMLGNFSCFFASADFFQNQLFQKILSGIVSECQTVLILIRPDNLMGLIWVKTVCKGYQQLTLGGRVKSTVNVLKF